MSDSAKYKHWHPGKCKSTNRYVGKDQDIYCADCGDRLYKIEPESTETPVQEWWAREGGAVIFTIIAIVIVVIMIISGAKSNPNEAPNSNGRTYYCDQYGC